MPSLPPSPFPLPSAVATTRAILVAVSAALAAAPFAPLALHAQSAQRMSVQASGISVGTFGEAYKGLKGGPGVEAQLRYTPSTWSFGAGFQFSNHDLTVLDENVKLLGAFFEPRRVIDVGNTSFAPYLSARLALLRQSADIEVDGTKVTIKADGTQINGGGGILFRVSPTVNLDLGATYGLIHFGDVKAEAAGESVTFDGTSGNGQNLVFRIGVAIGLK